MATTSDILKIAAGEIGITESPANSNNVKYNSWYYGHTVSGSDYPWCMVFVQWVYNQAGAKLPYTTASCSGLLTWYKNNQSECVVSSPQPGDIVIYNFGHTGIIESSTSYTITAIEGNTSSTDSGSQSNGGGVFRRTRAKTKVTAYIRPRSNSTTTTTTTINPTVVNYQVKVAASSLNCRSTYSTSGSVVTSYPNGTILTITKEYNGWGYTGKGWISLTYTTKIEEEEEMTQEKFNEMMNNYIESLANKDATFEQSALDWAQKNGIILGDANGRFMAKKFMTRGEAAVVLQRLVEKFIK